MLQAMLLFAVPGRSGMRVESRSFRSVVDSRRDLVLWCFDVALAPICVACSRFPAPCESPAGEVLLGFSLF